MRASVLAAAVLLFGVWHGPALAQGAVEERLERMEQRIRHLEERVAAQDRTIVEKDKQISALKGLEDGWFTRVEIGGAVELEVIHENDYDGNNPSDVAAGTVDLAASAQVNDWLATDVALTADDDGKIEVDEWTMTVQKPDTPVAFIAGRQGVPFGVYESNMVSDPLTKEVGDTADDAIQVALDLDGVTGAVFLFKGDNDRSEDSQVENFGFSAGYTLERDEVSIGLGLSWINDISEAGAFKDASEDFMSPSDYAAAVADIQTNGVPDGQGGFTTTDEAKAEAIAELQGRGKSMVAGGGASLVASFGGMQVIAEYVTAMSKFKPYELAFKDKGAKPSVWMVQAAYGFELGGKSSTFAVGYEGTQEAIGLELAESQFLVGFSIDLLDNLNLALEWARMQDYGTGEGGTGKDANKATAVLAAEF